MLSEHIDAFAVAHHYRAPSAYPRQVKILAYVVAYVDKALSRSTETLLYPLPRDGSAPLALA